jgi:carbon-monoxide dehydrogenase medium subunit
LAVQDGVIDHAGVGLAAVGTEAVNASPVAEVLIGKAPSETLFTEAGRIAAEICDPVTDSRGSAEYKRHLADLLTRRSLDISANRARRSAAGTGEGTAS